MLFHDHGTIEWVVATSMFAISHPDGQFLGQDSDNKKEHNKNNNYHIR